MKVSEQQAVKMWCPMVRAVSKFDGNQANAHVDRRLPEYTGCLGSKCMMWVWSLENNELRRRCQPCADEQAIVEPDRIAFGVLDGWEFVPYNPENEEYEAVWVESNDALAARRTGYCGLVRG